MTVAELIEMLEELQPNKEVRIASQPSWPFEYDVKGIIDGNELLERDEDTNEIIESEFSEYVYLVEGEQFGYFTNKAWELV